MTFLRIVLFSLATMFAFTLFANILPQVQSDPPKTEEINESTLDVAGQIAWGQRLFSGRGTCTLCHNDLGRAPDLLQMDLATAFAERIADARYEGEAAGQSGAGAIETYLRESMNAPSAFVVAGFGKKGTNDAESPMPRVDAAPLSLTETETNALIAYLQDLAGEEVTVPLPSAADAQDGADGDGDEAAEEEGPSTSAEDIMDRLGCAGCHDLFGSEADIGPDLAVAAQRLQPEGLRTAILDPNAIIAEGYEADFMPDDYAEQLWVSELNVMIDYLMQLEGAETEQ